MSLHALGREGFVFSAGRVPVPRSTTPVVCGREKEGITMKALKNIRRFITVEDGLVTVEWVAFTAGMVDAAVAIGFVVMSNTYKASSKIGGNVLTQTNSVYGPNGSNLKGG